MLDDDIVSLCQKENEDINHASAKGNDTIQTVPSQKVHKTCHSAYCHPSNIPQAKQESASSETTSYPPSLDHKTEQFFSFKTDCCSTEIDFEEQKRRPRHVFRVTTLKKERNCARDMGWSVTGQNITCSPVCIIRHAASILFQVMLITRKEKLVAYKTKTKMKLLSK